MEPLSVTPLTMCMSKVTLAAGTTTTLNNTGTSTFMIKGSMYTKAALSNTATPTVDAARSNAAFRPIVANQGTVVVIGLDSSGNVKAGQGSIEALDAAGLFINAPQMPILPDTICPIGYIVLKGGATLVSTWTFGTNNLSSVTGMTYTFHDIGMLPERPQVA